MKSKTINSMIWPYIKWILILLLIGFFCIALYKTYFTIEGFQTAPNVQYKFKEVFLVAPTEPNRNGNAIAPYTITSPGNYRSQGYTWQQAQDICRKYEGDLATMAQLQRAYDNSGNWCPAGWIKDSQTNVYNLPTKRHTCGITTITSTPASLTPETVSAGTNSAENKRAFAICYAPKPPYPSVSVQPFSATEYSMISENVLGTIMNGTGSDIFPVDFTISQIYYAIDNAPGALNSKNQYNASVIRSWLINNYRTVNNSILTTKGLTDDSAQWTTLTNINSNSCVLIQQQDNILSNKILEIKQKFQDISGYVSATIKSKAENANIQALLFSICSKTDPVSSPACAKLATLDFDKFYTNSAYNTLADLDMLNIKIYERREEICLHLYNVRKIKSILGCNYTPLIPACDKGCQLMSATPATATKPATPAYLDCAGTDIFDINNVGGLTQSLQEISPLFDVSAYKSILTDVITNLSYIIETPSLNNIPTSIPNLNLIDTAINTIEELIIARITGAT